jgi:hypothetical protein
VPSTEAGVVDGMGKSNNCVKGRMPMQCSGRVALLHNSQSQFNIPQSPLEVSGNCRR